MPSYNEIHGTERKRQLFENSQFLDFFKMSLSEIQRAFLARHHESHLNFALNYNLWSLSFKMSPYNFSVMFYDELKIENFCSQKDILPEKQKIR